jgi:hypothetical protein
MNSIEVIVVGTRDHCALSNLATCMSACTFVCLFFF